LGSLPDRGVLDYRRPEAPARTEEFDLYLLKFKFADGTGRQLCERIIAGFSRM
jgi:hypothetical protein